MALTKSGQKLVKKAVEGVAIHAAEAAGLHGTGEAVHFYHSYQHLKQAKAAGSELLSAASVQTAWEFGDKLVGVIGKEQVVGALVKYGVKLAIKSHQADVDAGNAMVQLMKSRVPVDTGRLLNGIAMEDDDGQITVTASAARDGDADYARYVEFGTKGGAVADESFFEDGATAGAALKPRSSGGGGSPARPFFWNSAHEVAEEHGLALDKASGEAAQEEGF
jgi:HK97 gp10 family phage protein